MRRIGPLFSVVLLLAAPLGGCGQDKVDRGLAPSGENAAPNSPTADAETDAQRQQQILDDMQKQQEKNFDAAASGNAPETKPAQ